MTMEMEIEMEPLNQEGQKSSLKGGDPKTKTKTTTNRGAADLPPLVVMLITKTEQITSLARMYAYQYPRRTVVAIGGFAFLLIIKLAFFRHRGQVLYSPPHLQSHFGNMESFYDNKANDVRQWCLLGDKHGCACSDPTEPQTRFRDSDVHDKRLGAGYDTMGNSNSTASWSSIHAAQLEMVQDRIKGRKKSQPDVVFIGDDTIEEMSGYKMGRRVSRPVQKLFNQSFSTDGQQSVKPDPADVTGTTPDFPLDGLSLGISGDTSANVLWRIQNGAAPKELQPKVFWLYVGTNDLTMLQCSEDVVSLGILRAAEEIARTHFEKSVVVVQGLLPRSPFPDGSLTRSSGSHHSLFGHSHDSISSHYVKSNRIPLWPSIKAINKELETFCENHPHLVYFDAASIFLGSLGNDHYQSSEKKIITELMHGGFHISKLGFALLDKAMAEEVKRIIYEGNENTFKAGGKR